MILAISNIIGWYNPPKIIEGGVPGNTTQPLVSGDPFAGGTLSVSNGSWANSPLFFYYQWKKDNEDIDGETENTYKSSIEDIGFEITCYVAATNLRGKSEYVASSNSINL
jgi:hypothetical protein